MGGFKCACGKLFSGSHNPGEQFRLVPDELFDELAWPDASGLDSSDHRGVVEASSSSLYVCGNCGRLHREDDAGSINSYTVDTKPPRIWADFTDRDEIGRIVLRAERSLADMRRQKLLFNPPLEVILYDDWGAEFPGEANSGLPDPAGSDETLWAVTLTDGPSTTDAGARPEPGSAV